MPPTVSVIIAARDEAARIGDAIDSAWAAGAAEVIVADGGSTDGTVEVARAHRARVIEGATMRSRQFNRGAEAATGETLIFLHADTLLPPDACAAADHALETHVFGGFRLAFLEPERRLRMVAFMINLRTALTRCPWGDQAQFVRRQTFLDAGAYREIPIMEDYELAVRMKQRGPTTILPQKVRTSGRRFLRQGIVRTTATNWRIIAAWHRGVAPDTLAQWYRLRE